MNILDTPQGMALLRTLNDATGGDEEGTALPTDHLIGRTMRRTRTPVTTITKLQFLRQLERLAKEHYVRQEGTGLNSYWVLTRRGRRAALEGNATAPPPILTGKAAKA